MKCATCGTEFEGNFCPACGAPAPREENPAGFPDFSSNTERYTNQGDRKADNNDSYSNADVGPAADDINPSPDLDAKANKNQGDYSYSSPDLDAASSASLQPPVQSGPGMPPPVYGQPPMGGGLSQPGNPYGTPKKKTNGCLVAGLIVGGFLLILIIVAIIIGVLIYNNAKESKDWVTGSGLSSSYSYNSSSPSSSSGPQTVTPSAPVPEGALSEEEIKQLYADPSLFTGRPIVLTGIVFTTPEKDTDNIYFQMFSDIENYEGNTVVAFADPNLDVKEDCYVRVIGTVGEKFEGESMTGAALSIPTVIASSVEVVSYMDAAAPTLKEVTCNMTQTQEDYTVTVDKVEFAATETRIYVTVSNSGTDNFHLYSFNTKLIQNNNQYEESPNYDADYPEIPSDLLPGATSTGVIVFEPLEQKDFKLYLEGYSDNYSKDFEPYTYDIKVQ